VNRKVSSIVLAVIVLQLNPFGVVAAETKGINVVTTTSAMASIIRPILSGDDNLTVLLPSNVEPHSFTLDPMTVQKALEADILVSSGHIGWEKVIEDQMKSSGKAVFDPLKDLSSLVLYESPSGGINLHGYWLDAENVKAIATAFSKVVSKMNPTASREYERNLQRYLSEINALESFSLNSLKGRGIYGSNAVIGFFEEQYVAKSFGMNVVGVLAGDEEEVGISPQKLEEIRRGLLNGTINYLVVSEIALELPLNEYIRTLSQETGSQVIYVRTLDIPDVYDFRALYLYNLGNVVGSNPSSKEDRYLLTPEIYLVVIAISVILNVILLYILFRRLR